MRALFGAQLRSRIRPQDLNVQLVLLLVLLKYDMVDAPDHRLNVLVYLRVVLEPRQDGHQHAEAGASVDEALGGHLGDDRNDLRRELRRELGMHYHLVQQLYVCHVQLYVDGLLERHQRRTCLAVQWDRWTKPVQIHIDLLKQRYSHDRDGHGSMLLKENYEIVEELLPCIHVVVRVDQEERQRLVYGGRVLVSILRKLIEQITHEVDGKRAHRFQVVASCSL